MCINISEEALGKVAVQTYMLLRMIDIWDLGVWIVRLTELLLEKGYFLQDSYSIIIHQASNSTYRSC